MAPKISFSYLQCQVKGGARLALTRRGPWHVRLTVLDGNNLPSGVCWLLSFPAPFLPSVLFLFPQLSPGRGHSPLPSHKNPKELFSSDKVLLTLVTNGPPPCNDDSNLGCINMIRLQGLSSLEERGSGWEGAHGNLPVAVGRHQKEPGCSPWWDNRQKLKPKAQTHEEKLSHQDTSPAGDQEIVQFHRWWFSRLG